MTKTNTKHKQQKGSKKEAPPSDSQIENYWRCLKCLMVAISLSFPMRTKTHRCLVCMKNTQLTNASTPSTYNSRFKKEIKERQGSNSTHDHTKEQKNPDSQTPEGLTTYTTPGPNLLIGRQVSQSEPSQSPRSNLGKDTSLTCTCFTCLFIGGVIQYKQIIFARSRGRCLNTMQQDIVFKLHSRNDSMNSKNVN